MNIKTLTCRREEFVQWVEMLPDTQTPSWLGLPNNAEKVLLTTQGKTRTFNNVLHRLLGHHLN